MPCSDVAYDKAVEVVTDKVREQTQKEDLTLIEDYKKWVTFSERNIPKDKREFVGKCLDAVQNKLMKAAQKVLNTVEATADILLKVFIEANSEKVEKAIQDAAEQLPEDKECDVGHSA